MKRQTRLALHFTVALSLVILLYQGQKYDTKEQHQQLYRDDHDGSKHYTPNRHPHGWREYRRASKDNCNYNDAEQFSEFLIDNKKRDVISNIIQDEVPLVTTGDTGTSSLSPSFTASTTDTSSEATGTATLTGTDTTTPLTTTVPTTIDTTTITTTTTTTATTATTTTTTTTSTNPSSVSVTSNPVTTTPPVTSQPSRSSSSVNPTKTEPSTSKNNGKHSQTAPSTSSSASADGSLSKSPNTSSSDSSSSNKTAITIGVAVGAVVIAGSIAVWIFRKAKLSPSRQFKSKIRNSELGGPSGSRDLEIDTRDQDNYADIFRPPNHTTERPLTTNSIGGAGVGAAPSVTESSPQSQHRDYQYQDYQDYQQPQQLITSSQTVPHYSQYRYAQGGHGPVMSSAGGGYESGVNEAVIGGALSSGLSNTYNSTMGGAKETVGNTIGSENLESAGRAQKANAQSAQTSQDTQTHAKGLGNTIQGAAQKTAGAATNDTSMEARGHTNASVGDAQRNV
ncbi:hypothetical protein BGX20_005700 [Mortierella sp. AD010]|nr:hypothetical protein BGX20_005700 [Mortierella sp. AD010]